MMSRNFSPNPPVSVIQVDSSFFVVKEARVHVACPHRSDVCYLFQLDHAWALADGEVSGQQNLVFLHRPCFLVILPCYS